MKLGIFSYLAWPIVCMVNHVPEDSNYIDAWLVYEAEDLWGFYKDRAEAIKKRKLTGGAS